mmetsp:Transcript_28633/g.35093  ORF Transcript_28633/g.35093 Transcript_28633/m.35093 type:complete len:288 (+) Transcript_28633:25-888(+)
MSDTEKHHWLTILCDIIGWIYFTAWTISFYPQTIINFRRKCVIGLSFDYQLYNFTGFLCYSIYTISTFIHNNGINNNDNPIAINDIAFAVHAFILTVITCIQILIYERGDQKLSRFAILYTSGLWLLTIYNIILSIFGNLSWFDGYSSIEFFGYVKVAVTIIKYIPQAYMNCRDKSTTGWSITNVLLDFTGGSMSLLQQILSGYNTNDWGFITNNIPKFILGFESTIFDILFMLQHYVWFGDNNSLSRQPKTGKLSSDLENQFRKLSDNNNINDIDSINKSITNKNN